MMTNTRSKAISVEIEEIIDKKLSVLASKESIEDLRALIIKQNTIIESLREDVSNQEALISKMNDKIAVLSNTVDVLKSQQDNQEQYSRRYCLRVTGIPKEDDESSKTCVEKVIKVCQDLNLDIKNEDIDRAHRIGKDKKTMIVKFHSFRKRTMFYKNRKNGDDSIKVHLDLTKRRLNLLDEARSLINNDNNVDFVFGDINCNTVAKLKDDTYVFFDSIKKFQEILS